MILGVTYPGMEHTWKKIICIILEAYDGNTGFTTFMIVRSVLVGLKLKVNPK